MLHQYHPRPKVVVPAGLVLFVLAIQLLEPFGGRQWLYIEAKRMFFWILVILNIYANLLSIFKLGCLAFAYDYRCSL